jgi:hypothetical protein
MQLYFLSYFNNAFYLTQSLIFVIRSYYGFQTICKNLQKPIQLKCVHKVN